MSVTVWLPPILVIAPMLGSLVYSLLFKPWRVKPIYRFLYRRSAWYRRWCWRRQIAAIKQMTVTLGGLVPAARKAAEAIEAFGKVLSTPSVRAALAEAEAKHG